jgi:hypothetical protein
MPEITLTKGEHMAYVNVREAYRRFNAEDAARQRYLRELRRIRLDLEGIELDMAESLRRQKESRVTVLTAQLDGDPAFMRTLGSFTGHTPYGWLAACGCDGRMRRLLRDEGWDVLKEVIHRIRYAHMWYKHVRNRKGGAR